MAYSIIRNTLILTYLFSIYTKKLNKMNAKIRNIKVKNVTYFGTDGTCVKRCEKARRQYMDVVGRSDRQQREPTYLQNSQQRTVRLLTLCIQETQTTEHIFLRVASLIVKFGQGFYWSLGTCPGGCDLGFADWIGGYRARKGLIRNSVRALGLVHQI
jgi:hypothetical protein